MFSISLLVLFKATDYTFADSFTHFPQAHSIRSQNSPSVESLSLYSSFLSSPKERSQELGPGNGPIQSKSKEAPRPHQVESRETSLFNLRPEIVLNNFKVGISNDRAIKKVRPYETLRTYSPWTLQSYSPIFVRVDKRRFNSSSDADLLSHSTWIEFRLTTNLVY